MSGESFGWLLAQAAPSSPGGGDQLVQFLPIILMFAVIYFIMIRPQQKQRKQHQTYIASLKKGDEVVTNSGILGKIDAVEDTVVRLEIARDVKIRVLKSQIAAAQSTGSERAHASGETAAKKD